MQQGSCLPGSASISAYESVLILDAYYKAFALRLEPFVTGDTGLPETAALLLRESVALGETLAQVLIALDSSQSANPIAYIRPGDIVVSLTDALLLMCHLQKLEAPLITVGAAQNEERYAQWVNRHWQITDIAQGLKKQSTAFNLQLAILSWLDSTGFALIDQQADLKSQQIGQRDFPNLRCIGHSTSGTHYQQQRIATKASAPPRRITARK